MKRKLVFTLALLLCMTALALAASLGPNAPGTLADDNSSGTVAWSNPSNAASSNNVYAAATGQNGATTHYLKATNFGFSIPSGATINGIVVTVEVGSPTLAVVQRVDRVSLVKGGVIGTQDRDSDASTTIAVEGVKTYGSSTQLWGETWTQSDINASTFGVVFQAKLDTLFDAEDSTVQVDAVTTTVYYTAASGSSMTSAHAMMMGSGE